MMITVTALFTQNSGDPATGLTLAEIALYLFRRVKATGVVSTVWSGQNPTEEIGGGLYSKAYTGEDYATYEYFAYGVYSGATVLDTNYALQQSVLAPDTAEIVDAVPTVAEIVDGVYDELSPGHTDLGKAGAQIWTDIDAILQDTSSTIDDLVDDLESRLGVPTNLGSGATIADNLRDIEGQTDDIGVAGAGLTAIPSAGGLTAQEVRDAMKLAPTAGAPATGSVDDHLDDVCSCADIDAQLSGTHGAGAWGAGVGASSVVYTATVDGAPADGVYCRMTTDTAGLVNISAGTSDSLGQVTFWHDLPSGTTVYIWLTKAGVEFDFGGLPYDQEQIP